MTPSASTAAIPQTAPASPMRRAATSLARGAAVYAAANFAVKAFNFLLVPLYTRFLAPSDYGIITMAESVAMVVSSVAGLGLSGAVARLYFQYAGDREELRAYTSSVIRFAAAVALLASVTSLLLGPSVLRLIDPHFSVAFYPFIATAIVTATAQVLIDFRQTLFQCEQRPAAFAALTIGLFLATAASVITLVIFLRRGAEGMLLGKCIAAAAAAVISLVLLWPWMRRSVRWRFVRESLGFGLPLIPHQFLALGLVVADRFILERYRDLTEVGLYSVAYTFGMVMFVVTISVSQAWSPLYFDTATKGDEGRRINARISSALALFLVAVACVGILIANGFVRFVLDARYSSAGRLIPWVIAGYLMHALFTLFHLAVLQGKKTLWLWPVSALALAANVALNLLLIPRWGMYGAAWATTAAYAVEAAVMYACAQRAYRLEYRALRIAGGIVVLCAALAASQVIPQASWFKTSAALLAALALAGILGGRDVRNAANLILRRTKEG